MLIARTSERQGRLIDRRRGPGSMEKKKREGVFPDAGTRARAHRTDGRTHRVSRPPGRKVLPAFPHLRAPWMNGKSTLIGRLLYDTKLILEDQLATL